MLPHPPEDSDGSARADRFRFERDRRRYVTAHAFLRRVLGRYLGSTPEAVALRAAAGGKPELASRAAPRFNLPHSDDVATVAARGAGLDLREAAWDWGRA